MCLQGEVGRQQSLRASGKRIHLGHNSDYCWTASSRFCLKIRCAKELLVRILKNVHIERFYVKSRVAWPPQRVRFQRRPRTFSEGNRRRRFSTEPAGSGPSGVGFGFIGHGRTNVHNAARRGLWLQAGIRKCSLQTTAATGMQL